MPPVARETAAARPILAQLQPLHSRSTGDAGALARRNEYMADRTHTSAWAYSNSRWLACIGQCTDHDETPCLTCCLTGATFGVRTEDTMTVTINDLEAFADG